MFVSLKEAQGLIQRCLEELDPEVLVSSDARELVEEFTATERMCAAGKALAARRSAASGAWRSSGERSAANWMARATGTSVGQALGVLKTAEALRELPSVDQSFRSRSITSTVTATTPSSTTSTGSVPITTTSRPSAVTCSGVRRGTERGRRR